MKKIIFGILLATLTCFASDPNFNSTTNVAISSTSFAVKPSVALVATTNQALSGFGMIDGVTPAANTLILATAQSTGSQNGPWQAQVGAWTRPTWYPSGGTTQAFQFITCFVRLGTTYQGSVWRMTTSGAITIDTTSTTWMNTPFALNSSTLSGIIPNSNTTGSSTNTALALVQRDGSGNFTTGTITGSLTGAASLNVLKAGDTMSGALAMGTNKVTGMGDPTSAQDAATKNYVDQVGLNGVSKAASVYATTAALPTNTYSNGSSGVGATLTGVAFGALTVDGNTVTVGQRILVKNEATGANNGIYTVTTVGAVATLYVLTRATDFNSSTDVVDGATTFITSGSTLSSTTWQLNLSGTPTIGTTSLPFVQIAGAGTIIAGTALSLSGNTLNVTTVPIANGGTGQVTAASAFNALSPNTTLGDLTYASGANTNARLAGNTSTVKSYFTQTGNGTISATPSWSTIQAADVPTLNQNTTGTASNVTATVAIANGGSGQTAKTAAFDALSPNTTKGDITVYNGTNNVRQAVGADGTVVLGDSTQSTGKANSTGVVGTTAATSTAGGGAATVGGSTTTFYTFWAGGSASATEASRQVVMPTAGTIKNFYVFFASGSAQPGTGSLVLTVRKNGVNTAVTITVNASATPGTVSDLTHSFTFAQGDTITLQAVNNASTASASMNTISILVTPQ